MVLEAALDRKARSMTSTKRVTRSRPSYFRGQLLDESDFRVEQDYHRNASLRHNTTLHSWGVVDGLTVSLDGKRVTVAPGVAVDRLGREIALDETTTLDLAAFASGETISVLLSYEEGTGEQRQSEYGEGAARTMEYTVLSASTGDGGGMAVTLAQVRLESGGNGKVSYAHTNYASSVLGPASVGFRELDIGLRSGWVRLPFKPFPIEEQTAFRIGPTEARSTDEGAAGHMAVPVPPGVTRVLRFRISGEKNEGVIRVEFFRCGWDETEHDHEKKSIVTKEFHGKGSTSSPKRSAKTSEAFEHTEIVEEPELDAQYHALAVVVSATKKASISLIAVEFAYPGSEAAVE